MDVKFMFQLILVTRKLIIEVLFNEFLIKNGRRTCIFNKTGFNVFYVIMKGVPIIADFKRPIYQAFDSTNLI